MDADGPSTALLTGCASGIGRHMVGRLAARGDRIIATDLDLDGLEAAARADGWDAERVVLRRLDVRDPEAWEATMAVVTERFGRLDVAMNIAGYLKPANVVDLAPADVDLHLDVNAKGVALGTRAAARLMVEQGSGHIINIGSLASLAPVPGLSLYAASKFAVRGFTLAAAQELAPHGVHVSLVMPDAVQTPMLELQVDYEEAALTFSGPRALTVAEVGQAIIDTVLEHHPLELALPMARGLMARISNSAPALALRLEPLLRKRGRANQDKAKAKNR